MRRVKTDRSLLVYILLTLVTLGIYGWITIYELAQDVNEMCTDDGKTTQGLLMYILLTIVTCGIYGIIWWYSVSERVYQAAQRRGVRNVDCSGGTFLLWFILGCFLCTPLTFIAYYKLFDGCNKVGAHYNMTGGQPPFGGQPPYGGQPFYGAQQPPYGGQPFYGQQQPPYGGNGNNNNQPPVW